MWTRYALVAFAAVGLLSLSGCPGGNTPPNDSGNPADEKQFSIAAGDATPVAFQTIGTGGGEMRVSQPGDPLDGLSITVPPGAFTGDVTFSISHSDITGHNLGDRLHPVLPLITVDTGGLTATQILTVRIPVSIPQDQHVMAFLYDRDTGSLEGATEITHDATSLTIATRHFSDILVDAIAWMYLVDDFTSGFQMTVDNWPFENPTTWRSPGGTCSGMSAAALYYYLERKEKLGSPALYGQYDSAGAKTPMPGPTDDARAAVLRASAQALRLCGITQWYETNYVSAMHTYWYGVGEQKSPYWTFLMFAHAMLVTQQPQYVAIYPPDDDPNKGLGHALIVYKKAGNLLRVADPNSPTDTSTAIEFDYGEEKFKPYTSKWNSGTSAINFTKVYYIGKTAVVGWNDLADLWRQFDAGAFDPQDWPPYQIKVQDGSSTGETVLADGYQTKSSSLTLRVDSQYEFQARLTVYDGATLMPYGTSTEHVDIPFETGTRWIGCRVEGLAPAEKTISGQPEWVWCGFDWFKVTRTPSDALYPQPWTVTITSPTDGQAVAVGEMITLKGTAKDADGDDLPTEWLRWACCYQTIPENSGRELSLRAAAQLGPCIIRLTAAGQATTTIQITIGPPTPPTSCPVPVGAVYHVQDNSDGFSEWYFLPALHVMAGPYLTWTSLDRTQPKHKSCYDANGKYNGAYTDWYTNGQMKYQTTFVHGVENGTRTRWYENGTVQETCTINQGTVVECH